MICPCCVVSFFSSIFMIDMPFKNNLYTHITILLIMIPIILYLKKKKASKRNIYGAYASVIINMIMLFGTLMISYYPNNLLTKIMIIIMKIARITTIPLSVYLIYSSIKDGIKTCKINGCNTNCQDQNHHRKK